MNTATWEASVQIWEQILRLNINMDFAYLSVGRSYLTEAKYAEAMAYFKLGNSRDLYSKAFAYYPKEVVEQNFGVFALAVVLIVLAVKQNHSPHGENGREERACQICART